MWLLFAAYGLLWVAEALIVGGSSPAPDWQAFYRTGRAVLDGTAWYATPAGAVPNLSPPLTAPLFAIFALAPIRVAYLLWTLTGVLATGWAVWSIARVCRQPAAWVLSLLVACHGLPLGLMLGQLHCWLFFVVTGAWLADREDRAGVAGAWLGVAIYLKPFFGLVLLYWVWRRAWRALAVATGVALGAYGIGALMAWQATVEWLAALGSVTWVHASVNLSVWGWVARADLPTWIGTAAAATIVVISWRRLSRVTSDQAWAVVLGTALLISPVAWLYYTLPLLGPVFLIFDAADPGSRWRIGAAYLALCVPLTFQVPATAAGGILAATAGSWYGWALLSMWAGIVVSQADDSPSRRIRSATTPRSQNTGGTVADPDRHDGGGPEQVTHSLAARPQSPPAGGRKGQAGANVLTSQVREVANDIVLGHGRGWVLNTSETVMRSPRMRGVPPRLPG